MKHSYHTLLRKALALTIMLLLLVNLTGCWKKDDADSTGESQSETPSVSTADTTEAATEAATEPSTEAPTQAPTEAPTEAPAKSVMGTVTAAKLNIRKGAGSEYEQISTYFKNDRIEILETKDGWGKTDKGWVNLVYVNLDTAIDDGKDTQETPDTTDKTDTPATEAKPTNTELVSDGKTTALGYGVVKLETLNVRTGPGTGYEKIDTVSIGNRYAYYQKSGNWARINEGWISISYFYIEGTTGDNTGTGTVTGTDLNIRTGPGTAFNKVGTYKQGDTVKILEQILKWGYTGKGWISMNYVTMDKPIAAGTTGKATITGDKLNIRKDASIEAESIGQYNKGDKVEILEVKGDWGRTDKGWISLQYVKMDETEKKNTGTVSVTTGLHIRKEPSKTAEILGSYKNGDKVTILETKDGWGKTDKGWISLDYVKMDA